GRRLVPYDLNEPAPVALAVELDEEHPLPGAEAKLAFAYRHRFACRAKQHRHAVRVSVAEVHVLGADVLGSLVPVVVRVVSLTRHEAAEQLREVLDEPGLELVDPNTARRVRGVDAGDAFDDTALSDRLVDLVGDVPDGQPAGGPELGLALVDLHGPYFDDSRPRRPSRLLAPLGQCGRGHIDSRGGRC